MPGSKRPAARERAPAAKRDRPPPPAAPAAPKPARKPSPERRPGRRRDARRDSMDFRDLIYRPALIALAPRLVPERRRLVILDQEDQGACTGFGLAAVVNFLEWERNPARPRRVSPRMLYEMALRHDQWPGQDYEGSSARGAMKGWFKSGVCSERAWPWDRDAPGFLTAERQRDALEVRLGAYYRVMPRRSDLHAALCEVGAVFASAAVHRGWEAPEDGVIPFDPAWPEEGGHAFAIVGYTDAGLLVQNSWGPDWGGLRVGRTRYRGVALWTYDDFDRHVWDLWVARLALPLRPDARPTTAKYTLSSSGTRLSTSGPPRHTIETTTSTSTTAATTRAATIRARPPRPRTCCGVR